LKSNVSSSREYRSFTFPEAINFKQSALFSI